MECDYTCHVITDFESKLDFILDYFVDFSFTFFLLSVVFVWYLFMRSISND